MEAAIRAKTLNDDAGAALRRAIGFAALFGLAGVASIACTARVPDRVMTVATDRLLSEEARLTAQLHDAEAIVFPSTLLARRADPAVAATLDTARRHFAADRAAAAARRDAIVAQIETVRAEHDLFESRRTVLRVKIDLAMERQAGARAAGDRATLAATTAQIEALQAENAVATAGMVRAGTRRNELSRGIAALTAASHARASRELAAVQERLRGG